MTEGISKYIILILLFLFPGIIGNNGLSQEVIRISPDLELFRISENAYLHVSYHVLPDYGRVSANGLIFINKDQAFLFDTPWTDSLTSELVSYMEDKMGLEIKGFVTNHWHDDCMGGLGYCMCKSLNSNNLGNTTDGDLSEYPKTIDKVIQKFRSAKVVIPGHGPPGGPELLTHTRSLFNQ